MENQFISPVVLEKYWNTIHIQKESRDAPPGVKIGFPSSLSLDKFSQPTNATPCCPNLRVSHRTPNEL